VPITFKSYGGSIGAGLFVGSARSLAVGGPASLILGFIITGLAVLCTTQALGELAVMYPVNGAFYTYLVRFIDPAWYVQATVSGRSELTVHPQGVYHRLAL